MYHVFGTGLTIVLLYILSYIFFRIKYFSFQFHKKLWNTLLAITFFLTALAGLFMALQITYKWDLPFVKTILKWHVEFGIGMAFIGIFHFILHLSYYGRLFEKQQSTGENTETNTVSSSVINCNLFIIGFVSSSVQFLLLREMLNIAGGYELVTGIFLGSWLIGSSIGSVFAGNSILNNLKKINLIFAISPVITIGMMLFLSRIFLNPGETPSFLVSLIFTLLVLLPFCIVSGFSFVKIIAIARRENGFPPGKSFSMETIGGVVAGISVSFLTSGLLNTYQLLLLIIILSFSYVLLEYYILRAKIKLIARIIILILAAVVIVSKPDIFFRQILLPGIKITDSEDTPYGNITFGTYKGEKSTYYDQRLLTYNSDVIEREENIHYAMLQSDSPEKVLLISGSLTSQLPEIEKYPVKEIVYIERDPALARIPPPSEDDPSVNLTVVNSDAFRYIRLAGTPADVIISSVPPPSTLQLNRYFTTEFFSAVKHKLRARGIFMCSPGPGNDYFNKESLTLYSSIYNSLSSVFKNVKIVVGNKLYFIASDKQLSVAFSKLTTDKNISNIYVSPDFLFDDLIAKKTAEITGLMDRGARDNKSSFPVAAYHSQSYNFSKYSGEKIPLIIILTIIFAAPLLSLKKRALMMYFSASALAGFEIITLLSLQIIVGNMYQLSGLIIASLMAGLAAGSGINSKFINAFSIIRSGIILLLFYAATGLLFNYLIRINYDIATIGILIFAAFFPAVLTGHIFQQLTDRKNIKSSASSVYSADLAGSALGFILISGIAIPLIGIQFSIILLSILILSGLLFGTIMNKL